MSTSQIIIFTKCRIGYNPTKCSTGCVSEKLDRFGGLSPAISLLSWFCFVFVDVGILVVCITDLFFSLDMLFGKTSSPDSWHSFTRCQTKKLYNTDYMFLHISFQEGRNSQPSPSYQYTDTWIPWQLNKPDILCTPEAVTSEASCRVLGGSSFNKRTVFITVAIDWQPSLRGKDSFISSNTEPPTQCFIMWGMLCAW